MLRRIKISKLDRGFLMKGRDYVRYLRPGAHWVFGFGLSARVVRVTDLALREEDQDVLLKDPAVWDDLKVVDLGDHERALVWIDGRLRCVLVPGRAAFWKVLRDVKIEVQDARTLRFEHAARELALRVPGGSEALEALEVPPGSTGVVIVSGKVQDELGPGRYVFWKDSSLRTVVLELREQVLEVPGQEVLTKDKATVRLNVALSYRVATPRAWLEASVDPRGALYRELQLAARQAVAARTLDELLATREALSTELEAALVRRAETLGAKVVSVGLKDVILPGELRALVHQVIEAEKRAQANLITRREETAATRALLNTAKLYQEHPALLRLKELEAAERIAERVKELHVSGLGEALTRLLPKGA